MRGFSISINKENKISSAKQQQQQQQQQQQLGNKHESLERDAKD